MSLSQTYMLIQIYEIQTPDEARMMIDLGVDHVGSVLISARQWKNQVLKSAIQLVQSSGRKSSLIPLFTRTEMIADAVIYYQPDILHFCDTLPVGRGSKEALHGIFECQRAIRDQFPELELMRSIPIGEHGRGNRVPSLELAALFEPISDWFLTDTLIGEGTAPSDRDQPVHGYIGITGKTCDWDVARALVQKSRIPVILAGGIGPGHVAAGIAHVLPAGVDSCTLTNQVDRMGKIIRFQKDPEKVKSMIASARQALLQ
jgi:phosphoribosylanthranilate isomerase